MTQLPPLIKGCCPEGKRRVLVTVSYDGTAYAGWQRQQNALAVQQVLEEALRKLTGEATLTVTGSSRTDAGVHALGQRVHFDTASRIPPEKFPFALNTCLPADIRVLEGRYVPRRFTPGSTRRASGIPTASTTRPTPVPCTAISASTCRFRCKWAPWSAA